MSNSEGAFSVLRQSSDLACASAIEQAVSEASDRDLCRVNPIAFAAKRGLDEEKTIAAFLHASRLGIFELSWNVLCPGCGGVLEAGTTLKTINRDEYDCGLCAAGYKPTLDEMVEVTFTVSPRVRRIGAHSPDTLPEVEYYRQIFWSSGVDLPETLGDSLAEFTVDSIELGPGEKAVLSVHLPKEFVIVFDPVTHGTQFIDVKGEPTNERLTNQTFRDIYRTDTLDVDQRLKITSLTFLFTDLKGSTALYERVGDLVAYDLVRQHFHVLNEIVAAEAGAIVKTIGDAVMATFPTPDRALSAALRMREAMSRINAERKNEDLMLKIGIHEGPCLAVILNDSQDYFGQTVNLAARVQGLAQSRAIVVTQSVVDDKNAVKILESSGLQPMMQRAALRGIADETTVYEIP